MVRIVTHYPHQIDVVESDLWIPMSTGHRLAARLWLPKDARAAPVPALLELLPYRKGDLMRGSDETYHPYFAGHGYASIRVDIRGSGDSFGVMRDEYEPQEQDDALEIIAWLAQQPWCTGRVGMLGISWSGFNALQVAARRPPALRAIITACSTDDRYSDDMHYMGGCLLNDNLDWGTTFLSRLPLPADPRIMGESWRENWQERLHAIEPPAARWMMHPTRDAYWKHGSINEDYAAIECPVFAVGGWLDGYSSTIPRMLANLRVPSIGIIGAHAHQFGFDERAPGPAYGFLQEALRWWDHWLKDIPTGITDGPKLRAFMGDDVPAAGWYRQSPGRWIAESEWPSPRIKSTTLFLNSEGLEAQSRPARALTHRSSQTVGLASGEWCPYGTGGIGPEFPGDQRLDDACSLTFDSRPLSERVEILGAPVVEVDLTVDRAAAFVAVRLNDVKPDDSATRVSFGILNLAHRNSHEHPEPVIPGARYRLTVQLNDAAYSFAPEHRIRVSISTTYWPMVWPSPEPVTLSVHPGTSLLRLPVRPPHAGDRDLTLPPAESAAPMTIEQLDPAPCANSITHDLVTRRTEVVAERGSGFFRIKDNDIEAGLNVVERMSVGNDDPLTAVTDVVSHARTGRAGALVNVKARSRLTADRTDFLLESSLEVREDQRVLFERTWRHKIPRGFL
ncbi:MAG: CocE/NonD family hydrolase [Steroidobacteraceae bacterium]